MQCHHSLIVFCSSTELVLLPKFEINGWKIFNSYRIGRLQCLVNVHITDSIWKFGSLVGPEGQNVNGYANITILSISTSYCCRCSPCSYCSFISWALYSCCGCWSPHWISGWIVSFVRLLVCIRKSRQKLWRPLKSNTLLLMNCSRL